MLYVCVWMLMKGSLSFDSNNAILTQNIHEGMGHVINYIQLISVQNWLKNQFFKTGVGLRKATSLLIQAAQGGA